MTIEKIKVFFPTALIDKSFAEGIKNVELRVDNHLIRIPLNDLSPRELCFIDLLRQNNQLKIQCNSPWEKYLFGDGLKPKSSIKLRFLYITVHQLDKEQKTKWQQMILTFFSNTTASFWAKDEQLVIVDEACTLSKEELSGMLDTVDSDFDSESRLLIGLVWKRKCDLRALFEEERQISTFSQKQQAVATVPDYALKFYLHSFNQDSLVLQTYRQMFEELDYAINLIRALYQVGGNVSQASKAMYVHRNTLEYRIDKLKNEFALNLRSMTDLTFCYLAIV